jgi:hypothetical protein
MHGEQHFICFDFDYYALLDYQIDAVASPKLNALIKKGRSYLPLKMDIPLAHFMAKTLFVCRLQKPRAKMTMNLNTSPNYALCNLVFHSA